jgi:hypothetical protein
MAQSDLLERLEQRAAPTQVQPRRGLNYNFPLQWYRRPDGDVVQLQSDPYNRTMYEDLGFVYLRASEEKEWLSEVRPGVIAAQKKRAQLITAIRKIQAVAPQYIIDDDDQLAFATMPLEELDQFYKDGCELIGRKIRLPAIRPEKGETLKDSNLSGVETSESVSMEEMHAKVDRSGPTIQGQGYDPIKESRRR